MEILLGGPRDGVAAAEAIRERGELPAVSLTVHSDPGTRDRARTTESFGCFLKPFDVHKRRITLTMALRKHRLNQQGKDREAQYRFWVENALDILSACDAEGIVTRIGPRAGRYGATPDAIVGHPFLDFVYPKDWKRVVVDPNRSLKQGEEFPSVFRLYEKAGNRIVVSGRRDDGRGFPDSHRQTVLDLFKRIHFRERYSGRGLGLSAVRKVVESMVGMCGSRRVGRKTRPIASSFENTRCHLRDVRQGEDELPSCGVPRRAVIEVATRRLGIRDRSRGTRVLR